MSSAHPTHGAFLAGRSEASADATSLDFFRLRWSLKSDSLRASIAILQDASDANSPSEPYSPAHPVSQTALTSPPVSALTVSIEILDDYATKWIEVHREHAEPDESPDHSGERFDAQGIIEHCCGQDRPGPGPCLEVIADRLVTIGQFVEAVRAAKGVRNCWPLAPVVDMYVWPSSLNPLRIAGREEQTTKNWAYEWAVLAKTAAITQRLRDEAVT